MHRTVAVVAHFDPLDRVDEGFRELVGQVAGVCDRVVVVSTSRLPGDALRGVPRTELVCRPNVGYDFMSYRAGLMRIGDDAGLRTVFLVNSSFTVLDPAAFAGTLRTMADATLESDVVGLTESRQFGWHLQSYLLAFGARAVRARWFRSFFGSIRPLGSKFEVILAYELGLSRAMREHGVRTRALFRSSPGERIAAGARSLGALARGRGARFWLSSEPFAAALQANPVHFSATPIARRHGIVKSELLVSNPHGIDMAPVRAGIDPSRLRRLDASVEAIRGRYRRGDDGLLAPAGDGLAIDPRRIVSVPAATSAPSRVAVALHLYYADLLPEILGSLRNILEPFDLFVTTPFESDVEAIVDGSSAVAARTSVAITENRGRDIRPFLMLLRSGMLDRYPVALKVHGKKSTYSARGAEWRRQILGDLVGTSLAARRAMRLFDDPSVGMAGSLRFFLSSPRFWGANRERLAGLMAGLGARPEHSPASEPELAFYAGSMFWFRPAALSALARLPEPALRFEPEDGQQDGTLAHACERAFALAARHAGYRCTAPGLGGTDIFAHRSPDRDVPVL